MSHDIVFFLAADDETAAATRNGGPGPALRSMTFHYFDAEDAIVEWTRHFEAPGRPWALEERVSRGAWPRYVADYLNDGVAVFVVPDGVRAALAEATPEELRGVAERWGDFLAGQNEDELSRDEQLAVVQGVAELAKQGLGLYCWVW